MPACLAVIRNKRIAAHVCARAGDDAPPQCTLGYAAPEVILAFNDKRSVAVTPAQDVWALGVMVFEALTRQPAVDPFGRVPGCLALARGERAYPWEASGAQGGGFRRSRVWQLVAPCLARDPAERPSAAAVVDAVRAFCNRTAAA